jgi:hypothetical protein
MSRTQRVALLFGALLTTMSFANAASAASYLDEAVQALQSDNVYVSLEATGVNAQTESKLSQQGHASDIAVVVLPANAVEDTGGNPTEFLTQLGERSDYGTVVVAFGDNLVAGSQDLGKGEAQQLADKAEGTGNTVGDDLLTFVSEVRSAEPSHAPATTAGSGVTITAIAFGVIVAVVLVVVVIGFVLSRIRREGQEEVLPKLVVDGELRDSLEKMRKLALTITGDNELRQAALTAANETDELFVEIRKALPDQIHQKTAEFTNHVTRVNRVLEVYLKAGAKPRHFDDAKRTQASARTSVFAYGENVRQNLVTVNEGELMGFEVDVRMLNQSNQSTFRPNLEQ